MMTLEEVQRELSTVFNKIEKGLSAEDWEKGKLDAQVSEAYNKYGTVKLLYTPDDKLLKRIDDYFAWCRNELNDDAGKLMEEIAALAFRCLRGWDNLESYQSYAAQHDLVISGSSDDWYILMQYLHLPRKGRVVVVEAKNLEGNIEDHHFSRLCSIVQNKFETLCDLGVFVSNNNLRETARKPQCL